MPNAAIHPTPQELTAFALGKLPEAMANTIASHLETCLACRQAIEKMPADSFVGKVRAARLSVSALPARPGEAAKAPALPPKDLPPDLANYGKYRFVRELGRGGMGVVYQAEQTVMGRTVAVKVINPSVLDHPDALPRFQSEVRAAAKLNHDNIVRAYDAEQVGSMHLLVMEYVEGTSLAELVKKKGPLAVPYACHYVRQAALGLQHAFEQGMVHRDIKPQNLMVNARGQVKVLDFGLARMRRERKAGVGLTQVDAFMGTPEYVSPEQATDARNADTRADIYSLGCTLFFLLTGRPPFQEDTLVKLVLAQIEKEPPALRDVRADVPAELSAVAARMLAKDPAQRFQTPLEVADALAAFVKAGPKGTAGSSSPRSGMSPPATGTMIAVSTNQIKKILRDMPGKASAPNPPAKQTASSAFAGLGEPIVSAKKKANPAKKATKPTPRAWYRRRPVLAGVGAAVVALGLGAWLLAGIVFKTKVKTAEGEAYVVLEIDQPNAEVTVDGRTINVHVPGDNKPIEIKVEPGRPHKLRVRKDGFEIVTRDVELKSGKSAPIRVRLEPAKVADKSKEQPVPIRPDTSDDGFVSLFNGKDLTGWECDSGDEKAWDVKDGELVAHGTEEDNFRKAFLSEGYLLTKRSFADFILRFHFKLVSRADAISGVVLRAKLHETVRDMIPSSPVTHPFHLTVMIGKRPTFRRGTPPDDLCTGALWWSPANGTRLLPNPLPALKKIGEWNAMEVEMKGQALRILVNGREVQNVRLNKTRPAIYPAPALSRFSGRIGFLKRTGEVRFRKIEIKKLPPPKAEAPPAAGGGAEDKGFKPLFTKPQLSEWLVAADKSDKTQGKDVELRDGIIVLDNPGSLLVTKKADFKNVEFTVELAASEATEAFVGVHLQQRQETWGNKTSLIFDNGSKILAGMQQRKFRRNEMGIKRAQQDYDQFFTMRIRVIDNDMRIFVNGAQTSGVKYNGDPAHVRKGCLAIQLTKGRIRIRKLDLQILP